jgi:ornithine--oxo-acid transaminase
MIVASRESPGEDCGPAYTLRPVGPTGRSAAEALMARGVLCKEAHEMTLRIAPPLTISRSDLDVGLNAVIDVLTR